MGVLGRAESVLNDLLSAYELLGHHVSSSSLSYRNLSTLRHELSLLRLCLSAVSFRGLAATASRSGRAQAGRTRRG
jgi:hypothetical protein